MSTYYFIVNPGSKTGKGSRLWAGIEDKLKSSKIDYNAFFTKESGDATKLAAFICNKHPEMKRIVVVGGDGTANEAINGLSDYDSFILGYVPTGSGNDLARGLGIADDTLTACENVIHPHAFKQIDHGMVKSFDGSINRKFGVSSGIGYDADICYSAEHSKLKKALNKIKLGKLVYYLLGFKHIFSNKPAKAVITIDGKHKHYYKKLIFAANMNTVYEGGGMPMAPAADPTDGKITVTIVHDVSKFRHLLLMFPVIKGKHINHKGVEQITARKIEVETDRPLMIHTDGEYAGRSNRVTFSCIPEKVRMIIK
ncbi:MAG: diacylglycerol kinase family lipid kinase [Lachnospiraceae bacterium]|nr:diacylglycerol kinase family lipid kinase [Lachnospiraceae bacterium]